MMSEDIENEKKHTITVNDEDWLKLNSIKYNYRYKNLSMVIHKMLEEFLKSHKEKGGN